MIAQNSGQNICSEVPTENHDGQEVTLSVVVDIDRNANDPEKSNFDESVVGSIEFLEDRFYVTAGGICLGFDRYTLAELIRRAGGI